ncbi:hypothetical protein OEZ85_011974 [Tetradesmus obliquus]|uniref:Uncharacterized protein n=1 Tax=Tetradesmus obliquus TaxID=3088 RepID=A0ABY8TRZ4_TETOB|nr:hypothetical protein OEZ85_011974 [Tetradesmus obliquus]
MGKGLEVKFYTGADPEYQAGLKDLTKKPLRCDDRIEDFCRVVLHSNHLESLDNLKTAWGTLWACLRSEEGQEPNDPYVMLQDTDPLSKWFRGANGAAEDEQQQQQQQQRRRWQPPEQQQQQQQQQEGQQEAEMQPKAWWRRQT